MTDRRTIAWYDEAARKGAGRHAAPNPHLPGFIALLPPGGSVLDLGCGGGDASAAMDAAGLVVTALDASAGLLDLARAAAPGARFIEADFADLDRVIAAASLDGVWANFVLLHAPRDAMPDHLDRIARALRPGGILHLSMLLGTGEGHDRLGRFYTYHPAEDLRGLLAHAGFTILAEALGESGSATGESLGSIVLTCRRA